jgi:hypothetical protein
MKNKNPPEEDLGRAAGELSSNYSLEPKLLGPIPK